MKKMAVLGALIGLAIPMIFTALFLILSLIQHRTNMSIAAVTIFLALIQYIVWPSQALLIPFSGAPWHQILPMFGISVLVNMTVYIAGAVFVGLLRRPRGSTLRHRR